MKHQLCPIVIIVFLAAVLASASGCASMSDQERNATIGAIGGAIPGAVIGAARGGIPGAAIGAAAGAMAGAAIGASIPPPYSGTIVVLNPQPVRRYELVGQVNIFFAEEYAELFKETLHSRGWRFEQGFDRTDLFRFCLYKMVDGGLRIETIHPELGARAYIAHGRDELVRKTHQALGELGLN